MTVEVEEVRRIAGLPDPVIRNLQITECYSRLAAAIADRHAGANWCTFATWASRQAGGTIRGEDLLDALQRELGRDAELLHPIDSLWRVLLRRGLFNRESRFGRFVGACTRRSTRSSWRATRSRAATARCSPRSGSSSPAT